MAADRLTRKDHAKRIAWFVGLWVGSVAILGAIAFLIRLGLNA